MNDVLLASTGTGTLGKACVYNSSLPAVADGHVTIIRADKKKVDPHYLADYLRVGAGSQQIQRLYTGSTGLIELTEEAVSSLVIDLLDSIDSQKRRSKRLRAAEKKHAKNLGASKAGLQKAVLEFSRDSV